MEVFKLAPHLAKSGMRSVFTPLWPQRQNLQLAIWTSVRANFFAIAKDGEIRIFLAFAIASLMFFFLGFLGFREHTIFIQSLSPSSIRRMTHSGYRKYWSSFEFAKRSKQGIKPIKMAVCSAPAGGCPLQFLVPARWFGLWHVEHW